MIPFSTSMLVVLILLGFVTLLFQPLYLFNHISCFNENLNDVLCK